MYSSDKGGALWLIHYISGIRQCVSSFAVHWLLVFLRPIHSAYRLCVSCKAHTVPVTSPFSDADDLVGHNGRHIRYAKICFGSDQTQHMFIYPALTLLYPVCHFAWQSLQAIHHGTRSHDLWRRLSLIHKSQKDQFKIHEQSVLLQPVISVTVGQWRRGAAERKSSASPRFTGRHTGTGAHTLMYVHSLMHKKAKGEKEVLMGVLTIALLM